ncbi:MAG: DUF5615 family PIN-like protein [Stenomitos rutilans HA7619-LM2]|jgi:predicted nuclease of predicted toxin-antitoxin system|nr:DUF5615 family PIN-like protein [Stenomitos rutilans HA7619-LM2]
MAQTIRFHLDESVSGAIAVGLRRRGIDVTTTPEVGLLSASDETQLSFAISQNRVIVTHDDDFLVIHRQGTPHSGIAYCKANRRSIGEIVQNLTFLWEVLDPEDMHNHIEFL